MPRQFSGKKSPTRKSLLSFIIIATRLQSKQYKTLFDAFRTRGKLSARSVGMYMLDDKSKALVDTIS